jgi:hypothetical protein
MAAKHDIQQGISAEVAADRDVVIAACRRAAQTLGERARLHAGSASLTVEIRPGLARALTHVSPVVGISLQPSDAGRVSVQARVERHRESRPVFGFLPAGLEHLVGRGHFRRFLDALEIELVALDPVTGRVRRLAASAP